MTMVLRNVPAMAKPDDAIAGTLRSLINHLEMLAREMRGAAEDESEMLAEAMCKLKGFHYQPDPEVFWIHGKSTETDFIYITTQSLSCDQLRFISDQVGTERTLLICCAAFHAKRDEFPNLTMKKVPQAVLNRCEWGRDDYSLNVDCLPPVQVAEGQRGKPQPEADDEKKNGKATTAAMKKTTATRRRRKKASAMQELPLFAGIEEKGKSK